MILGGVSEIIDVRIADVVLDDGACVQLRGKGRKQRSTPLRKSTIRENRAWLKHNQILSNDAALLPSLESRHISPHTGILAIYSFVCAY